MNLLNLEILIPILGCLLYIVIGGIAMWKRGPRPTLLLWLLTYLGISFAWSAIQVVANFEPAILPREQMLQLSTQYGILATSILFLHLSLLIFRPKAKLWLLWLFGILWAGLVMIFSHNLLDLSATFQSTIAGQIEEQELTRTVLLLGWGFLVFTVAWLLANSFQKPIHPIIKNKAYYWTFALFFVVVSDGLYFGDFQSPAIVFRVIAVLLVSGVCIYHHMPEIRRVEREALTYLVSTILTAILLLIGIFILPSFLEKLAGYNPTLAGAVVTLLLAAVLTPIWVLAQRIVNRLLPTTRYDPNRILREYSQNISNILDPNLLATVAIGLVNEALEITHGHLFLVELETEENLTFYRLRSVKGMAEEKPAYGTLGEESPITEFFINERNPLRNSDLDLLPRFQSVPPEERTWLEHLKADLYVPIFTKDEWIGLISLGAKVSGQPYFNSDLTLISTLADQTAVALQNARLVESLMRLNNDFRRAYAAMEQANRHLKQANTQLEILDRTKSDFISIASHELRTPLTVMRGYTEMLMDEHEITQNSYHQKLVDGIHAGTIRLHEIVDSMLDMASIDTHTLELQMESISLFTLIRLVGDHFREDFSQRNLTFEIEDFSELLPIEGDPEALRKVFHHLIVNAIKYTPDGGKIIVAGSSVPPGYYELQEGGIEITIRDTGIGINPEFLESIFTKFYQTGELAFHSTGKTKFKGAGPGLGLAIARGIIQLHRGKIWAESPGYDEVKLPGSTFHVVFPVYREE